MSDFGRGWALILRSTVVMRRNPKLLFFPLVTALATAVTLLFILTPLSLRETGESPLKLEHWKIIAHRLFSSDAGAEAIAAQPVVYTALVAIYFLLLFVSNFTSVAFFSEIMKALSDRPVSIRGGLKCAASRLPSILIWTLLTGGVGLLIKAIERQVTGFERISVRAIGVAWRLASLFVTPIIVREPNRPNPLFLLKTSASLLKKTWGESVVGYVGPTVLAGILLVLAIPVPAAFLIIGPATAVPSRLLLPGVAVWFLFTVTLVYVLHVLSQVFLAALFVYATEGVVPGPFDQDALDSGWKLQHGRSRPGLAGS